MSRAFILPALTLILSLVLHAAPVQACGADSDCALGDRTYRIYLPQGHDGTAPMGALFFAHGYKGSAQGTMRNTSLRALADRLGVALVAANSAGDDWRLPGTPSGGVTSPKGELAYFDALRAEVLKNYPVDPDRLIASGFSAGGMMTWTLACHRPDAFAGFIPLSGTFWAPVPDTCAMPAADIVHIHGTADRIVPLTGRPIGEAHQGDVDTALAMYRRTGQHRESTSPTLDPDLTCSAWTAANQAMLLKCLHGGAHRFKSSYIEAAWRLIAKD